MSTYLNNKSFKQFFLLMFLRSLLPCFNFEHFEIWYFHLPRYLKFYNMTLNSILEWSLSPMNMSVFIIFSGMNAVKLLFKTMDQKTIQKSPITIIVLLNFLSVMMSRNQRTITLNRIHIRRLYRIANILQNDNILNSKALFFAQIKVNQEIMTNL